jgi:hypothetical protein
VDWIDLVKGRHRQVAGASEYSNGPLGSIKCREFLD